MFMPLQPPPAPMTWPLPMAAIRAYAAIRLLPLSYANSDVYADDATHIRGYQPLAAAFERRPRDRGGATWRRAMAAAVIYMLARHSAMGRLRHYYA